MPIKSFGIEHGHPNLKLCVFPIPEQPNPDPQQRSGSPNSDVKLMDHFMAMACLASLRSKDKKRKAHNNN